MIEFNGLNPGEKVYLAKDAQIESICDDFSCLAREPKLCMVKLRNGNSYFLKESSEDVYRKLFEKGEEI